MCPDISSLVRSHAPVPPATPHPARVGHSRIGLYPARCPTNSQRVTKNGRKVSDTATRPLQRGGQPRTPRGGYSGLWANYIPRCPRQRTSDTWCRGVANSAVRYRGACPSPNRPRRAAREYGSDCESMPCRTAGQMFEVATAAHDLRLWKIAGIRHTRSGVRQILSGPRHGITLLGFASSAWTLPHLLVYHPRFPCSGAKDSVYVKF